MDIDERMSEFQLKAKFFLVLDTIHTCLHLPQLVPGGGWE